VPTTDEVHASSPESPEDDPLYASLPHERLDLSGDSMDTAFNSSSDAELEADHMRLRSSIRPIVDLMAPSPPRGSGIEPPVVISGNA
jgi:hypothetical protein